MPRARVVRWARETPQAKGQSRHDARLMLIFDLPLGLDAPDPGAIAAAAEAGGAGGVWSTEAGHDPYLPLALAAAQTSRVMLGTAIAVAFPRSPLVHAQVAWDLHRMAPGRFVLGLGAQVKAHNQRRYSAPFDHPVGRMRDMVGAIRAIWDCWQNGTPLNYEGEFYQHTLMTPFFNPGPVHHGDPPPIYVSAVSEPMLKLAGAVADGVHVHPLHTAHSLDVLTLPVTRAAATQSGRDADAIRFVIPVMLATGRTPDDVRDAREPMRAQIAFYASTPAYRAVLEAENRGDVADQLHALSRQGRWTDMPQLIDDEFFDAVCVSATWDTLAEALLARYRGRADRIMPYTTPDPDAPWTEITTAIHAAN